ncbi:GntR family transcriptional regulator [Rhizobacter sp. J219]|uniref:GntR family transcriptional regulator n=1 Tax=Rhizobacter sp. J219 TaxID=2898430 RepID=UPI0021509E66|nr:GntR family transcriptional regulator [Rhizobacter sp. J219]MCR5884886.1 GntR family transcriptional regulator [Rhizobacter sp. J219]
MLPSDKSDAAYTALKQAIIEGALTPGTKLPEDSLGTHFGMSRTLIRAALARLVGEGLVVSQLKRTATVAQPSIEEARSVFELRRCLEAEVVRLVIARWEPAFGAALEGHVRQEEQAAKQQVPAVSARLAGEFHQLLAHMAGNALLERYVDEVVSRCSLILAIYGRPHTADCAIAEHRELIAALRRGDERSARKLMSHHLDSVEQRALHAEASRQGDDLGQILARYAEAARPAVAPMARKTTKKR